MTEYINDDILSKFLEETKAAERKKQKPKPVELPENFVVYDPKAAAKKRRDAALAQLSKFTDRPDIKKSSVGSIIADRMKNPAPSVTFATIQKKKEKEEEEVKVENCDDELEIDM